MCPFRPHSLLFFNLHALYCCRLISSLLFLDFLIFTSQSCLLFQLRSKHVCVRLEEELRSLIGCLLGGAVVVRFKDKALFLLLNADTSSLAQLVLVHVSPPPGFPDGHSNTCSPELRPPKVHRTDYNEWPDAPTVRATCCNN